MPKLTLRLLTSLVILSLGLFAPRLYAEEIRFPPGAAVVNVVTDLGIDNTGKTDVAPQLNAIIEKLAKNPCVLYFPNGTYLVASRVRGWQTMVRKDGNYKVGPFLIGESRTETVIRLKDGTWPKDPFGDTASLPQSIDEQVVLYSGDLTNTTFRQIIQNLTVNIGRNNAGATGIVYIASNSGHLDRVDIVSEDGQGAIGLALTGEENGPGLVRDVSIRGFKRGIYSHTPYNFVLHDIKVLSTGPCLINKGRLTIEDFKGARSSPGAAIITLKSMTLVGAQLVGKGDAAIENTGLLYARNITASGFSKALSVRKGQTPAPTSTKIGEYTSTAPTGLFQARQASLGLEIRKTPHLPWENDPDKWINLRDVKTADKSWATAFQEAIDTPGKTHLLLPIDSDPKQRYGLEGPVYVRGDISRIVGTSGRFDEKSVGKGTLIIEDGTSPIVVIENMFNFPNIIIRTNRTVILDTVLMVRSKDKIICEGGGEVFLNTTSPDIVVNHPDARVYARQFNHETTNLGVSVQQGSMWILGWKSENLGMRGEVGPGGRLEILGFDSYEVGRDSAKTPIFNVTDGLFSIANLDQHGKTKYDELVRETRKGETRSFSAQQNPEGHNIGLYTGY